jgi:hypothetical protein
VALVERVAHRLADEMRRDREARESVAVEEMTVCFRVTVVGERRVDVEVVSPAGELEAVEPPAGRLLRQLLQRQVGPLAGEERHRSCHALSSFRG